jgi:tripartite-type tricarboxylate transporter receptor subunit TctC
MANERKLFQARLWAAVILLFSLPFLCPAVQATGAFPEKPVKVFQGSAAGGTTDLMTRMLASLVTETLGQPVIVVVKAGASGTVAANEVAQAKPDGYTLLSTPILALAVAPFQIKVKYDSLKDFEPLIAYAGGVYGICVLPDSPWKTFKELIEYARAHPGELSVSTPGVGSTEHLTFEQVARQEKISWKHVPYPGGAPAAAAVLGGHVKVNFGSGSHLPFVEAGKFRVLALNANARNPKTPDIPTLKDLGYDIPVPNSFMIVAPKGMPENILKIHEEAFLKAARGDVFKEFLKKLMLDHDVRDRAAAKKTLETEYQTWSGIIERLGIKPK